MTNDDNVDVGHLFHHGVQLVASEIAMFVFSEKIQEKFVLSKSIPTTSILKK